MDDKAPGFHHVRITEPAFDAFHSHDPIHLNRHPPQRNPVDQA